MPGLLSSLFNHGDFICDARFDLRFHCERLIYVWTSLDLQQGVDSNLSGAWTDANLKQKVIV